MPYSLDERQLLYVTAREAWRAWLEQHYRTHTEVWLVYYKKHTGRPRLSYNDAVEEALCFGWIDSIVKRVDEERTAQRFSVRNPKTPYSQANKERLREMIRLGKVMPEVLAQLGDALETPFEMPPDILAAIQAHPQAWEHFQTFSAAYIRIRVAFIDAARQRPDEFNKRLTYFIAMTAKNKQIGFGGIEKYY